MLVSTNTPESFVQALKEDVDYVDHREVWLRIDSGKESDTSVQTKWQVSLTALIRREGSMGPTAHILEFQQIVGIDVEHGADQTNIGSKTADAIVEKVKSVCKQLGLKARSGRIEF